MSGRRSAIDALIKQALKVRIYHLAYSRGRVGGKTVKAPCHFLLYRQSDEGVIEVARILHDSRDLARHLPEEYRR